MKYSVGIYPNGTVKETVATGVLADQLGFQTMWILDSHVLFQEVYVLLGAIASQTKRIRLGTAVTNPITRHLTVTSSAFSTLDELSGGRATLGICVGDSALKAMGLQISTVDNFDSQAPQVRRSTANLPLKREAPGLPLAWKLRLYARRPPHIGATSFSPAISTFRRASSPLPCTAVSSA